MAAYHGAPWLVVIEISTPARSSMIGVAISLTGNVLISLALNCQKLAHLRLQREAQGLDPDRIVGEEEGDDDDDDDEQTQLNKSSQKARPYGSTSSDATPAQSPVTPRSRNMSRTSSSQSLGNDDHADTDSPRKETNNGGGMTTDFLRSRLWWLGFGLMSLGEFGNFLSYGFAPASLVAPLGAVALLSNVIISPILLKERFRPSDIGGIVLAIVGAVTVVFSSKQSDATLDPDSLLRAVRRTEFIVYTCISVALAAALAWASSTRWGDRYILLDVGVCALFGGFTVLSTKGLSSLLSTGRPLELLRYPIAYAMVIVLVGTALAQITYLNRALQRFDSREVIPTQFVTFTISAIVGSAILYQDFADMDVHRLINFLFGCATTFAGVLVLTRHKHRQADAEQGEGGEDGDEYEDVEGEDDGVQSPLDGLRSPASAPPQLSTIPSQPVAVPRTHPAAANAARRGRRRLQARRSIVSLTASGSAPTTAVTMQRAPGGGGGVLLSSSLQEVGGVGGRPVVVARRSIFNPAFTIAYLDQALPPTSLASTPRRQPPFSGPSTQR